MILRNITNNVKILNLKIFVRKYFDKICYTYKKVSEGEEKE